MVPSMVPVTGVPVTPSIVPCMPMPFAALRHAPDDAPPADDESIPDTVPDPLKVPSPVTPLVTSIGPALGCHVVTSANRGPYG